MSDTQWPRFVVFHQAKPDDPHLYSGSVHASDPEMALFNARDVFVRRPECVSLWVVRAESIFTKTAEELSLDLSWLDTLEEPKQPPERYYIFLKLTQKGQAAHVGEVEASTPHHALKAAIARFADRKPLVWWVAPAKAVTCSTPEDIAVMFDQASDKAYFRDQGEFRVVAAMRKLQGHIQDETVEDDEA